MIHDLIICSIPAPVLYPRRMCFEEKTDFVFPFSLSKRSKIKISRSVIRLRCMFATGVARMRRIKTAQSHLSEPCDRGRLVYDVV